MNRRKRSKKFPNFWLPPILWAAVIFLFSSLPTIKTSEIYWQDFVVKKLAHIIEYGIFSILLYRGLKSSKLKPKKAGLYAILIAIAYGITDEIHQTFTPGREPKIRDVFFDTLGASLAIYAISNFLPKSKGRVKSLAKRFEII